MILQTQRLLLREFLLSDASFILALLNTPAWLEFIGDRNVHNISDAERYLENGPMKSYRENGYGLYCVVRKEDNLSIGMCGLIRRPGMENPDIGFAFLPSWSGKGYGYEIAAATLLYAGDTLKIPVVDAITTQANVVSISLLEKLGMKKIGIITLPGGNEELLLFRKR